MEKNSNMEQKAFTIDITPEGLKTEEGRKRNAEALDKWNGFQANVANKTSHFMERYQHIIELGMQTGLKSGHLDDEELASMKYALAEIKCELEEMHIAQENFQRSFRPNWEEYNPKRREVLPQEDC